jgi:hypothetical protein
VSQIDLKLTNAYGLKRGNGRLKNVKIGHDVILADELNPGLDKFGKFSGMRFLFPKNGIDVK